MEKITLTFLGTSASIPTKTRNHPAMLLSYKSENILIDCGEGTQRQFRLASLSPAKITRILITHWHGDHTLGLPGLLETLAMSEYSKELYIYGPTGTSKNMDAIKKLMSPYKEFQKFKIIIKEISSETVLETPEILITAKKMSHGIPSLAYSFKIKDKLRIDKKRLKSLKISNSPKIKLLTEGKDIILDGKKISHKKMTYLEKGRKVTFIMDTLKNPNALNIAKSSDLLITECTFSDEDKESAESHKHLTSKQAAQIAKDSNSKSLILTHISQRYDQNNAILLKEAKAIFPNTKIAKDLMEVSL